MDFKTFVAKKVYSIYRRVALGWWDIFAQEEITDRKVYVISFYKEPGHRTDLNPFTIYFCWDLSLILSLFILFILYLINKFI